MNFETLKSVMTTRKTFAGVLCLSIGLALINQAVGQDTNGVSNARPNAVSSKDTATKPPKHTLTGAELYSIHCNRCHPERYPTERTAAQWKTILMHMRVRANLPAEQSRTILRYLQENSGR